MYTYCSRDTSSFFYIDASWIIIINFTDYRCAGDVRRWHGDAEAGCDGQAFDDDQRRRRHVDPSDEHDVQNDRDQVRAGTTVWGDDGRRQSGAGTGALQPLCALPAFIHPQNHIQTLREIFDTCLGPTNALVRTPKVGETKDNYKM